MMPLSGRMWSTCFVVLFFLGLVSAQDCASCYGGGSIAGAVLGTFFVTLLLVALTYVFYEYYWKVRKGKQLMPKNDPENVKDEFAFDNPGFKEGNAVVGGGGGAWLRVQSPPNVTKTTLPDDKEKDGKSSVVALWSRDFTGLGMEVSGSMRDGVYVSSVLRGGPAAESGRINTGDRINSVHISFRHMAHADALAILSHASPYELQLEVERGAAAGKSRGGGSDRQVVHPLVPKGALPRASSHSDLDTLEKATRGTHFPKPAASPNSTLDTSNHSKNTSASSAFKKILSDKISTASLERPKHKTTLERENEKNMAKSKMDNKNKMSEENGMTKPRVSSPPDVVIIKDGSEKYGANMENVDLQKKSNDQDKKGMKFGIRVLPPNIPNDVAMNKGMKIEENAKNVKTMHVEDNTKNLGNIVAEIRSIDEVDKNFSSVETEKKAVAPVVAKRREKPIAPIPNARNLSQVEVKSPEIQSKVEYENVGFTREDDLNSSGIRRDSKGIPQEMPAHMMDAAMYAKNNRKSSGNVVSERNSKIEVSDANRNEAIKNEKEAAKNKKSKGKAPCPPNEGNLSKYNDDTDDSTSAGQDPVEYNEDKNMNFTDNFEYVKTNASQDDTNKSDDMILGKSLMNTSTPKADKVVKRMRPDIPKTNGVQLKMDDTDSIEIRAFQKKEASDSLNNYFDDSKSNLDANSVISLSQDSFSSNVVSELDKIGSNSTTIELNSSDITIHSSPIDESIQDDMDDNERKAASLGDLSRLETADKNNRKPSQGTLERAQSLDISAEDNKMVVSDTKHVATKKRKSNSVFDGNYFDDDLDNVTSLESRDNVNQPLAHSKEPRLSLNISNVSMEGLNTFQRNRLKKASEWGNMEDAIMMKKDNSNSGSSELAVSAENLYNSGNTTAVNLQEDAAKLQDEINKLKFVSNEIVGEAIEKAVQKTNEINERNLSYTREAESKMKEEGLSKAQQKPQVPVRNMNKSNEEQETRTHFEIGTYVADPYKYTAESSSINSSRLSPKLEDKLTIIYDTNIPDDIKVSRHTLVSSLERPKSDLMKKLLAQNPALNVAVDKGQNNSLTDVEKNDAASINEAENPQDNASKDARSNATTLTFLNQPDVVNLRVKQNKETAKNEDSEFISSINIVGASAKEAPKINFKIDSLSEIAAPEKAQPRNFFSTTDNVVTITTDGSQPSSIITIEGEPTTVENFRNSIEIKSNFNDDSAFKMNDSNQSELGLYNEIISELQKQDLQMGPATTNSSKTYLMEGSSVNVEQLPGNKTVTVHVTEDKHGNKIVTQNIEQVTNRIVTVTSAPIEIEQYTFGIIRNPTEEDMRRIEDMDMCGEVDSRVLSEIERQNPNMKIVGDGPRFTNSDTMMINANLTEDETNAILAKIKDNPQVFMTNIEDANRGMMIKDEVMALDESDMKFDGTPIIKMSQASYKFRIEDEVVSAEDMPPKIVKMIESDSKLKEDRNVNENGGDTVYRNVEKINKANGSAVRDVIRMDSDMDQNSNTEIKDYITEIEVMTPRSESAMKSKQNLEQFKVEPYVTSQEFNSEMMGDFLNNERSFANIEHADSENYERRKSCDFDSNSHNGNFESDSLARRQSGDDQKSKRHSDFDLPRNTHIKFRTATYEPQSSSPNKLNSSEKRLSQIEILKSNFEKGGGEFPSPGKPLVSSKPSSIPVKLPEKQIKSSTVSPSKIPVLHSQKAVSQENLVDKGLQRSPPGANKLSTSMGNISITSIKSSSRNPSGK